MKTKIPILSLLCLALAGHAQITNVNIGTGPDTHTGDTLLTSFTKINNNFRWIVANFLSNGAPVNANSVTGQFTGTFHAPRTCHCPSS